uniref:Uncharacterized protein n=1 Tax=Timema shepardi TaxID=629360 RepID=A0A7R9G198_TIMSH|nr:unnamed protein product [Timema shepardi]
MIDNSWCGWGSCFHPSWMQKFNRPGWYLIVFGLYGWTQCMAGFYFTSTIPTIEKRFKFPSKITGIIMSGNDVSIVALSLLLTYYGSKRNRPLLMGVGGVITAMSCFLVALPHFIYGPGKDALALTKEFWDQEYDNLTLSQIKEVNLNPASTGTYVDKGISVWLTGDREIGVLIQSDVHSVYPER